MHMGIYGDIYTIFRLRIVRSFMHREHNTYGLIQRIHERKGNIFGSELRAVGGVYRKWYHARKRNINKK